MTRQKLILDLGVATNNTIKELGNQMSYRSDYSYNYTRCNIDIDDWLSDSMMSITSYIRKTLLIDFKESINT